jgi:hypothetical protein
LPRNLNKIRFEGLVRLFKDPAQGSFTLQERVKDHLRVNVLALLSGEFVGLNFLFNFKFMKVERGVKNGHLSHILATHQDNFLTQITFCQTYLKQKSIEESVRFQNV